ncbi:MAG: DUF3306 domain-containing protein [Pseudomonadota bacterium]
MISKKENFLARWSRLKRQGTESAGTPPAPRPAEPVEPLPALDSLDFSSDFSAFLRAEVEEQVKRAALKKLFHSDHFNRMDGLDVYIDDYNQFEPLTEDILSQLNHARELLSAPEQADGAENRDPAPTQDEGQRAGEDRIPPDSAGQPT